MSDCNRVTDLARTNINETSLTALRGVIIGFAERKNIALCKGLPDVLAREVAARLDMPDLDRLLHSDADASAMAAYAVNRRLDEYAAMVLAKTAANVRDGTILSVETLERIGRTKADEIEANAQQRSYRVWPNIAEEVLGAYPSLPLGPITEVLPDAVYKTCWLDCKLHRDPATGPAYVKIDLQGHVLVEEYWVHGVLHRPSVEGPALVEHDAQGRCMLEIYSQRGKHHRDPGMGPALIQLDERGYWQWLEYRIDGRLHRPESEGPAILQRRVKDGRPIYEAYYLNDSPHRDDGPAVISYGLDGCVTSQAFWRQGEFLGEDIFGSEEGVADGA